MIIDAYTHIFPAKLADVLARRAPYLADVAEGVKRAKPLSDLDARFRLMDGFGDYRHVVMLPNPPLEEITTPATGVAIAREANDAMAELVRKHPDRFAAFAAALPMHEPEAALIELERAITDLGAAGVQIYTNVAGKPLDSPEFAPFFAAMARHDRPIWMHPARAPGFTDYSTERRSRYQIWWCFGWPYETSSAMARIVFSGLFDRHPGLKIITHHMGGMTAFFDERIADGYGNWVWGWERGNALGVYDDPWALADRTETEMAGKVIAGLKRPLIEYFKMFYADTALNGGYIGLRCGLEFFGTDRVLFSTDAPFTTIPGTIEAVRRLELSAERHAAITRGNVARLLKCDLG